MIRGGIRHVIDLQIDVPDGEEFTILNSYRD
jgi:hypothetical protein